jgi:deoxyxylulose-5-phosphate synthase
LPQRFVPHGRRADLLASAGLDRAGISDAVLARTGAVARPVALAR